MKKIYITLAVLSLAAIMNTACDNREEEIKEVPEVTEVGDDAIAFSLGGVSTRAEVSSNDVPGEVNIIPLGTDDQNNNFYLEESVIDLDVPVTRGTPVYTENLRTLYGASIPTYAPDIQGSEFNVTYDEAKKLYVSEHFHREIWPAGDDSYLEFYMHMPASPTKVGDLNRSEGKITFSYTSPETAADQQDIIFTYRKMTKAAYDEQGYVDILFHHALTGVKFATKNSPEDAVTIKEVRFTGLIDQGTCTVTPTTEGEGENAGYSDIAGDHSSAKDGVVVWSATSKTGNTIKSGAYPLDADGKNILVDFSQENLSFAHNGVYPASFSNAGNENNLNDGDATQTFWLIPQAMTDDIKLTIEYTVKGASETTDGTWTIDFGKALKNVTWKAGQIRTYTIKVDDVNVKIADNVTIKGNENDGFKDSSKTDVVITNTGNTDAFIRAAIIGQWLDEKDTPVFGFTDYTSGKIVVVESWYQDQFKSHTGKHGEFVGLAGYSNTTKNTSYANPYPANSEIGSWYYNADDGYYYFTKYVGAGSDVPVNLFESYTVGTAPIVSVAGAVKPVYFVMEIATQAISAKKLDTGYYTWQEAWANAANVTLPDNIN